MTWFIQRFPWALDDMCLCKLANKLEVITISGRESVCVEATMCDGYNLCRIDIENFRRCEHAQHAWSSRKVSI